MKIGHTGLGVTECPPGFNPSSTPPTEALCPAGKQLGTISLKRPDGTYCYECVSVSGANPNPSCPPGYIKSIPNTADTCPSGQVASTAIFVPGGDGKTYCYQCLPDQSAYQAQVASYYQQLNQFRQQQLNAYQQRLNAQISQFQQQQQQRQATVDSSSAAPMDTAGAPAQSLDTASYPAGLTPPPAVSWKGLGQVVLALAVGAFVLNKFGGGKKTGGGGKRPVHHIEKKETFDVEV